LSVLLLILTIPSCGRERSQPPTSSGKYLETQDEEKESPGRLFGNACPTAIPLDVVVGTSALYSGSAGSLLAGKD